MKTDLVKLLDEQEETNYRLDEIDDRFLEFFRQSARDKMDLMEMLRERSGGGGGGGAGDSPAGVPDTANGIPLGLGGLAAGITAALGTIAAYYLNELGAVFIEKIPGALKKIGGSITEFTKNVGQKFSTGINNMKTFVGEKATSVIEKAKDIGAKIKEGGGKIGSTLGAGVDKVKGFFGKDASGYNFKDRMQLKAMGVGDAVKGAGSKALGFLGGVGKNAAGYSIADRVKLGGMGLAEKGGKMASKLAPYAAGAAKFGQKALNRFIAPITAGYDGYKMGMEREDLSGGGKVAAAAGGAASSFVGGMGDFMKFLTVDAIIEAGQRMGMLDKDGLAQAMQESSVQRDVFDPMVRTIRDTLADGITSGTIEQVRSANGSTVVFTQNNNQKSATSNTTSFGTGQSVGSPTMSNGTRAEGVYSAP